MSKAPISKNDTSISGEYYMAHILAKYGFKVSMTLGRMEGFDLFVQNPSGKLLTVSVKTRYSNKAIDIPMNKKAETLTDKSLFYAFVRLNMPDGVPEFWIVPSNVVAKVIKTSYKIWKDIPRKDGKPHGDTDIRTIELRASPLFPKNWVEQLELFKGNIESLKK